MVDPGEEARSPCRVRPSRRLSAGGTEASRDEFDGDLFKACGGRDFADRRDTALLTMFIDTGARLGELAGLHVDHLDLDVGVALVLGKGRRRLA